MMVVMVASWLYFQVFVVAKRISGVVRYDGKKTEIKILETKYLFVNNYEKNLRYFYKGSIFCVF